MDQPSRQSNDRGSPLLPIGVIVLGIALIPALLSSTAPDGPVKTGDVVFSTDRHRAYFVEPERFDARGYSGFCLLEPRDRLLIVHPPAARADGRLVARTIGETPRAFPFCPPHAEVVVNPHHVTLSVTVWRGLRDFVTRLFSS